MPLLAVDFDYHDLPQRACPLLAAPALAASLRYVASLSWPKAGNDCQIHCRGKG
jgi:hypothetical protein